MAAGKTRLGQTDRPFAPLHLQLRSRPRSLPWSPGRPTRSRPSPEAYLRSTPQILNTTVDEPGSTALVLFFVTEPLGPPDLPQLATSKAGDWDERQEWTDCTPPTGIVVVIRAHSSFSVRDSPAGFAGRHN